LDGSSHGASDLVVQTARESDLDAIFALECASFAGDRLSLRALRRFLREPHRPLLTARSNGRMIGYILISLHPRFQAARIYSLAVQKDQGGRGVGRQLLMAAERYARAHGRARIRLEARYDNLAAIALYEKLGYLPIGRHSGYYDDGAEALRFEKALTPPKK
jgi:ribosomal-protein-alanine N-acetyltransferase